MQFRIHSIINAGRKKAPDSFIYMTDADCDLEKAKAALPPVSEKRQKIIYDRWCSYVEKLLDTVEIHTTDRCV